MNNNIRVIGMDPAPAKGTTIFDPTCKGLLKNMNHDCLLKFLNGLKKSNDTVLICWDAPLTGPSNFKNISVEGNFTKRPIEKFLSHKIKKEGVNTQGYASCQHWTITKHFFGLPIMGGCDEPKENLPFKLITDSEFWSSTDINKNGGKYIVEVHPAVAIYFWLGKKSFKAYKGKNKDKDGVKDNRKNLTVLKEFEKTKDNLVDPNTNDDDLDSIVAYVLGNEWINSKGDKNDKVRALGDKETGMLLLPYNDFSVKCWEEFPLK